MFIKRGVNCPEIIGNDGCHLKEVLHPDREAVDLPYSLAVARVALAQHTHAHSLGRTEVYYIISGRGCMHVGDETQDVATGDAILIPAGEIQWIENTGDDELLFVAIVNPPWDATDDVLLNDKRLA